MMIHRLNLFALGLIFSAATLSSQAKGPNADFLRACRMIQSKQYVLAEKLLAGVVRQLPNDAEVWFRYAQVLDIRKKAQPAKAAAAKAIKVNPKHARALLLLAQYSRAADSRNFVALAKRAAHHADKDWTVKLAAARLLLEAHDARGASKISENLVRLHPQNGDILYLFAESSLAAKRLQQAASAYAALAKVRPFDPWPTENLASVQLQLGQPKLAIVALKQCLKIRPSNLAVRQKLIGLLVETKGSAKDLRAHRIYLRYYKQVEAARGKRSKPKNRGKSKSAKTRIARPGHE